jgi:hypothetical protein
VSLAPKSVQAVNTVVVMGGLGAVQLLVVEGLHKLKLNI